MADAPLRLLYDAECGFCRWSVARLLVADKNTRLLPITIQSPEGQELLSEVPKAARLATAHCVTPDGHVHSGGAAYSTVAAEVPALRITKPLADGLPSVVNLGYELVAGNRSFFGRWMTPKRLAWADGVISDRVFEAAGL